MHYKRIIAILVSVIFCSVPLAVMALPKKDFSDNENRVLQKAPKLSVNNIISGNFSDDVETYMNDHFPLRDNLVSLKSNVQYDIGYKEINNVFITKDRLLQHIEMPKTDLLTGRINRFCKNLDDKSINVNLMVVPTNAGVYSELLPKHAPEIVDEKSVIKSIYEDVECNTINVLEMLLDEKKKEQNLYYNLDHHWNYYGAYVGYKAFCKAAGNEIKGEEDFGPEVVSKSFKGSLYSKVLIDTIPCDEIIAPKDHKNLKVNILDKKKTSDTYFDSSFLSKKDKYCYFGSGNQGLTVIENKDVKNDKEIVIVKDSFANCFVPFLFNDYKKIHIIDPRYYMPHVSDYVKKQKKVTDVLFLYNLDSLNINSGIVKIK